jgi:cytochrome c2
LVLAATCGRLKGEGRVDKKIPAFAFPALMLVGLGLSLGALFVAFNANPNASTASNLPVTSNRATLGQHLFVAKGCVVCHRQEAGSREALDALGNDPNLAEFVSMIGQVGPNLDHLRADPAFLHRWLKDPSAVKPGTAMPTLNLSDDEIEALIAFLTSQP